MQGIGEVHAGGEGFDGRQNGLGVLATYAGQTNQP
jgi:hypothetical protein